jgi:hypothetical protein
MSIRISGLGAPMPSSSSVSSKLVEEAQKAQAVRAAKERAEDARIAAMKRQAEMNAKMAASRRPAGKPVITGTTALIQPKQIPPPIPSGKMAPPVAKSRVILQPTAKPDDRTKAMATPANLVNRAGSGGIWPGLTDKKPQDFARTGKATPAVTKTLPRSDGGGGMTASEYVKNRPVFPKAETPIQAGGPTAEQGMTPPPASATDQTTWEGGSSAGSAGESGTMVDTTGGNDTLPMLTDGPKVESAAMDEADLSVSVKTGMSTGMKFAVGTGVLLAFWVWRVRKNG